MQTLQALYRKYTSAYILNTKQTLVSVIFLLFQIYTIISIILLSMKELFLFVFGSLFCDVLFLFCFNFLVNFK